MSSALACVSECACLSVSASVSVSARVCVLSAGWWVSFFAAQRYKCVLNEVKASQKMEE